MRYRDLYQSTPAMMHSIDPRGALLSVSDRWLEEMGYARDEVIGRPSTDFLTPESREKAETEVLPAFFRDGRCDRVEYRFLRRDGSTIDVLLSARLERDARGAPVRSLAILDDVTEKRRLAAQLLAANQHVRAIFDNVPAMMSYWDRDGINRMANRRYEKVMRLAPEQVRGMHLRDVGTRIDPGWYERNLAFIENVLRGQPQEYESAAGNPDDPRWTHVSLVPEIGPAGEVLGFFVHATDITRRKRLELALARSESFLRQITDHLPARIAYIDRDERYRFINPGLALSEGRPREELVGLTARELLGPEIYQAARPYLQAALRGEAQRFEIVGMRTGRQRYIECHLIPDVGADGVVRGMFATGTDITERLTERERRQELVARVAELSPSAMLLVDPQERIAYANAQTEAMFGYDRAELAGTPIARLIPQALHEARQARRKDGTVFDVEVGLKRLDTPEGAALLAAVVDVTQRRRDEQQLHDALREKETLLKEIYHRVKNNLQVIQSLLSLQRRGLPAGPARSAIDNSEQRVRAMALVHEKLYQSGSLAAVSLRDYTQDLLRQIELAVGASQRRIRLHAQIGDLQTGLDGAVPYGLLVTELVGNCLKHAFAEDRGGEVHVALENAEHGLRLVVSDDGIGLPPGFDPLQSRSLGLKLAASLARQLGGELQFSAGSPGLRVATACPGL